MKERGRLCRRRWEMGDGGEPPEGGTTERGEGSGGFAALGRQRAGCGKAAAGCRSPRQALACGPWGRGFRPTLEMPVTLPESRGRQNLLRIWVSNEG